MRRLKKWLYGEIGGGETLVYKMVWEWIFLLKNLLNLPNKLGTRKKIKKYFKTHDIIRVQVGCGDNLLKGFLNTDFLGKVSINITKKLPFSNNSVHLIYSNHTVEHIYHEQFKNFLKEAYRVLKQGGIHIISTPSIEKLTKSVYYNPSLKKKIMRTHTNHNEEIDSATLINRIVHMRYMHKFLYDFDCINRLAKKYKHSKAVLITNPDLIPDEAIRKNIKDRGFENDGITETYMLVK